MKHILFPTDFSLDSQNAFLFAASVADTLQASITLLHVHRGIPHPVKSPFSEEIPEWLAVGAYDRCFDLMVEVLPPGIPRPEVIEKRLEEGPTVEIILEVAKTINADLIIAGTRGASGIREVLIGSNTSRLIEHADIAVLAIPDEASFQNFNRFAMPIDFMDVPASGIEKVLQFARAMDAQVSCFHVNVAHNPLLKLKVEKLEKEYEGQPIQFEIVDGNYIPETIMNYAHEHQTDLLAIVTHHYDYLERLFNLSYGEKLVLHSDLPVLAVK